MGIPAIEPYPLPTAGDLPANAVQWAVEPQRAVLLIHDMQRYFLKPMPSDSPRDPLMRNIAFLRERCDTRGVPVAYTAQPGAMTDEQRGLLKDFWGPGMASEPADRLVVEGLTPASDDWMFTKWRYSAFFGSDMKDRMRGSGRDQLILCGVYAHVGVLATAIEAFSHDIQVFLVADAVADFSERHHRQTLEYAAECCAMVVPAKELLT